MKKFKMPDSYTILFVIIIIIALLSWFVPSGQYVEVCDNGASAIVADSGVYCPNDEADRQSIEATLFNGEEPDESLYNADYSKQYEEIESNKQGFWQIANAPINGFYDAVDIALFVLVIGGFINIVMQTGAIDAGVSHLLRKFDGKEYVLIPILMIIFGLGGTSFGMAEETIGFYPLIIPVFLAAGYDSITGVRVILLGAGTGVLASTVNPFAIGAAVGASGNLVGIGDGLISRAILFIILEAIVIGLTLRYAHKVKEDMSNSVISDYHEEIKRDLVHSNAEIEFDGRRKAILTIFVAVFIIMVLSVMPWGDFNVTAFDSIADFINTNMSFFGGTDGVVAFGGWWFGELTMLFFVGAIIIGIIAKQSGLLEGSFSSVFIEGCRDIISVALVVGLARGITMVMQGSGMDATLLNAGSQALQGLGEIPFTLGAFGFFLPMSFLIPSTSGLATAAMPILAPLAESIGGANAVVYTITAFSAASGILNLITPTSGVVMGGLQLGRVPYDRWIKHILPEILLLIAVCAVYLAVGVAIGA